MFGKTITPTPGQRLVDALASLESIREAVRDATGDLRVEVAALTLRLETAKLDATKGDQVYDNLSALLGD